MSNCWSGGCGFDPRRVQQHSFEEINHEIFSSVILSVRLIQEGQPGWLGEAKVLCILHHWGVQLILTCSWARPAILAAVKGRGGMFLFLLFLHCHSFSFLPYPSLSSPLLSLFSLSLGDDTKWRTWVDVSLNPNTINNQEGQLSVSGVRMCTILHNT